MDTETQPKKLRDKVEIINEINSLVDSPGYIYCLFAINAHDLFLPLNEFDKVNWQERISYQEINYLFGLLSKKKIELTTFPTEPQMAVYVEKTYSLLEEIHKYYSVESFRLLMEKTVLAREKNKDDLKLDFFSSPETIVEMVFYDESGAYDFQYWETAIKRYSKDTAWIKENLKFSIEDAVAVSKMIKEMSERKHISRVSAITYEEILKTSAEIFTITVEDFKGKNDNIEQILNTFSVTPGIDNKDLFDIKDKNELNIRPLIKIGDKKYLIPVSFFFSRSIDESPFTIMFSDKSYKSEAEKHRGDFTEDEIYEELRAIFGAKSVFRRVKVKTLSGNGKVKRPIITDIDVLVLIGNKAIIVQAKSKKMTLLSRQGSVEKFVGDFELGIQEAYVQGIITRRCLLEKDAEFEDEVGKKIVIEEKINEAYIIIVSTDYYPGIGFQTTQLLKKEKDEPFPLALNLYDLKLLTKYLPDPIDFTFYVNQRTSLADKILAQGEITLLGFHLKSKLYIDKEYNGMMVTPDFAQLIDDDIIRSLYGTNKDKEESKLNQRWRSPKLDKLIKTLKRSKQPSYIDVAFYLMTLSQETIDELFKLFEATKNNAISTGKRQSFTMEINSGGGVSYIVETDSKKNVFLQVLAFNKARKYKARAKSWLTMGSYSNSDEIIDAVVYTKGDWVKDAQTEELGEIVLTQKVKQRSFKIGRNERCFCGSGKKYKKCHYLL